MSMVFFVGEEIEKKYVRAIEQGYFKKHVLSDEDDTIKELYCVCILAIYRQDNKKIVDALLHVGKIIRTYSEGLPLYRYFVKALKSGNDFWSDAVDLIRGDLAYHFCVDLLIVSGGNIEENKNLLDWVQKFGLDIKDCYSIFDAIVKKDYVKLLLLKGTFKPEGFLGYFENYNGILRRINKEVGDVLKIGEWKGHDIEWEILEMENGMAFVLSRFIIKKMVMEFISTWDNCPIQSWLNNDFYSDHFSEQEKDIISCSFNQRQGMLQFCDTEDKIFLLSTQELFRMLEGKDMRCYEFEGDRPEKWWLRTPGKFMNTLDMGHCFVDEDGKAKQQGLGMVDEYVEWGIRPAMRIDLRKAVRLELERELENRTI